MESEGDFPPREASRAAVSNVAGLRPFTIAGSLECEPATQTPGLADLFCQ
ncbi:hypothetical protein LMG24076_05379 [Trinickia soli]|nr:hypothetical protein LMG24076_05379 [Trinickia soli]